MLCLFQSLLREKGKGTKKKKKKRKKMLTRLRDSGQVLKKSRCVGYRVRVKGEAGGYERVYSNKVYEVIKC